MKTVNLNDVVVGAPLICAGCEETQKKEEEDELGNYQHTEHCSDFLTVRRGSPRNPRRMVRGNPL
jgi:hypothetical protein